jgi:hypothetical protein
MSTGRTLQKLSLMRKYIIAIVLLSIAIFSQGCSDKMEPVHHSRYADDAQFRLQHGESECFHR